MRTIKKISGLKYFEPVDISNEISKEMSDLNLDSSFDYFASQNKKNDLFLNRLSHDDIMEMLKKAGLIERLQEIGVNNIQIELYMDELNINFLRVYYEEIKPEKMLIDLRVSESRFLPDKKFLEKDMDELILDMVVIEWLSTQKPNSNFDPDRPQLPGQNKPGLGILGYLMNLMYILGREVIKDGFMDIPNHFHGAVMYSRKYKFFNPASEAILKGILRDLKDYPLADLSWGFITRTIIDKTTGEPQIYEPSEQIFPVSQRLNDYFKSKKYQADFNKIYNTKQYYFDYNQMLERKKDILKDKKTEEL